MIKYAKNKSLVSVCALAMLWNFGPVADRQVDRLKFSSVGEGGGVKLQNPALYHVYRIDLNRFTCIMAGNYWADI